MNRALAIGVMAAISVSNLAVAQNARSTAGKATSHANENAVARGKYIVEGVAMGAVPHARRCRQRPRSHSMAARRPK